MPYPKAIGPYSAYRQAGDLIFLSGQLPLDPDTMQIASERIQDQTRQCLQNIQSILKELNLEMSHIIKTTIFLANIDDFAEMNAIYSEFFSSPYPARSAFAVQDLPKGQR